MFTRSREALSLVYVSHKRRGVSVVGAVLWAVPTTQLLFTLLWHTQCPMFACTVCLVSD